MEARLLQGLWSRRQWKLSSSKNGGGSDTGTQGTAAVEAVAGRSGHGWEGKKM